MNAASLLPARERALSLWRDHPREIVAMGAAALVGVVAIGGSAWSSPNLESISAARAEQTAPAPPPLLMRNIDPSAALAMNSNTPLASGPNPAASPFSMAGMDSKTQAQALECLTSAVYYEAGNQSEDGERAVAQVVLNRVRHPAFPSSVCGVVYQGSTRLTGCQFTFTCDGSLERRPSYDGWARAKKIAEAALNGAVFAPVGLATHYHADYVVPYWASTMAKNAVIGAHLFYRWAGSWGRPSAYIQHYAKQEPNAGALKMAALAAFAARPAPTEVEEVADIPGAEIEKAPPGRVAVKFNLATLVAARRAAEEAPHHDYVDTVAASDNLRWTLSAAPEQREKPLGRASAGPPASSD